MYSRRFCSIIRTFPVIFFLVISLSTATEKTEGKIRRLVHNGSVVLNDESGNRLIAINEDKLLIPASIIKVLTAHIALDLLGSEYRFKTEFYTNEDSDCAIKGFGDPFLVSDEIRIIAKNLKEHGLSPVAGIVLDDSYFADDLAIPGVFNNSNPYNALNGALVVNFNTINVVKTRGGKILSGEEETPLTPLAVAKAAAIASGTKQRINLSAKKTDCQRYAGELFRAIFKEYGLATGEVPISQGTVTTSWKLVYTHYSSKSLTEVIKGLMKYSNNFIANQIFLAVGAADSTGGPATLQKSREVFEKYIRTRLNISSNELTMVEGSGISRKNRITGSVMIDIMEQFKPHADLIAQKKGHLVKSGTLSGVSNYAGYIRTDRGLRSFVIMLNQKRSYRDDILRLLVDYSE